MEVSSIDTEWLQRGIVRADNQPYSMIWWTHCDLSRSLADLRSAQYLYSTKKYSIELMQETFETPNDVIRKLKPSNKTLVE